jgi:hypothetical protein
MRLKKSETTAWSSIVLDFARPADGRAPQGNTLNLAAYGFGYVWA